MVKKKNYRKTGENTIWAIIAWVVWIGIAVNVMVDIKDETFNPDDHVCEDLVSCRYLLEMRDYNNLYVDNGCSGKLYELVYPSNEEEAFNKKDICLQHRKKTEEEKLFESFGIRRDCQQCMETDEFDNCFPRIGNSNPICNAYVP